MKEVAIFGAGCFWCVEAIYDSLHGVTKVEPGYMGGSLPEPSYKEVCSGTTGHAEIIRIEFNSDQISYSELLEVFWASHDPTTLNRQGNDRGTQYRSVIFYISEEQKELAEKSLEKEDASGDFKNPIVTEISKEETFWVAENYHHDYLEHNPENPYCQAVVSPKFEKFKIKFAHKLKSHN